MLGSSFCKSLSNDSSSMATSPPSTISSPPLSESPSSPFVRRLQSHVHSTMPRLHELWNPGVYSSFDTTSSSLVRTLTITTDSGRESADSSFSDPELSPPPRPTRALTIYQIEKAKAAGERERRMHSLPPRSSYTASSAVFVPSVGPAASRDHSLPPSASVIQNTQTANGAVLRILIPPSSPPNTLPRKTIKSANFPSFPSQKLTGLGVNKPMESKSSTTSLRDVLDSRLSSKHSDYRVSTWEPPATPGRIENFEPETDRRSGSSIVSDASSRSTPSVGNRVAASSSSASSSVATRAIQIEHITLGVHPQKLIKPSESGHTLSDVSSCVSDVVENVPEVGQTSTGPTKEVDNLKEDFSSSITSESEIDTKLSTSSTSTEEATSTGTPDSKDYVRLTNPVRTSDPARNSSSSSDSSVSSTTGTLARITRMSDAAHRVLQPEFALPAWRSKSVEHFGSRGNEEAATPRLVEEKQRRRVVFPDVLTTHEQPNNKKSTSRPVHVYENIDDLRDLEHPQKVLSGRRSPFRQSPRVPVLSLPAQFDSRSDVGAAISTVSFRFYDSAGCEQNSLSKRVSAQLLKRSAMRMSLPRNQSAARSEVNRRVPDFRLSRFASPPSRQQTGGSEPQQVFRGLHGNSNVWIKPTDTQKKNGAKLNFQSQDPTVTVNGKQRCAHCRFQLGRGQAMAIDALNLFYHMPCFKCARCGNSLNTGNIKGTDVRVNGNDLYCHRCYDSYTIMTSRI